ncbi:hypothetical protein MTO98_16095 [Mucilaginibacter sp. SMC90]|uniref:hypothetical protein n=1 Tax=Mucilaginibacter sp. SMC90 TaxID=2929803 RepID=UPI001FB22BDE|nr:hypothetical protein [Mucilaginibacter sp. SMC90]UOE52599.1 hypothetical protein MTO98_16095 [Mucilaginibacter sp. SMC90]
MEIEPGRCYERPCAIVRTSDGREYAIPVFDHLHADPQFGFPHKHYHIDGRFYMEPRMGHEYRLHAGHTSAVIRPGNETPKFLRIETRILPCVQTQTGLTFPETPTKSQSDNLERYEQWYASYIGKSCAGKRCPHFGTEMLDKDGRLVCPMHELTADPDTMRVVARYSK